MVLTEYTWTNAGGDNQAGTAGNWNPVDTGPGVEDRILFTDAGAGVTDDCTLNIAEVYEVSSAADYTGTVSLGNTFKIGSYRNHGENDGNALVWGANGIFDCATYALTCNGGVRVGFDGVDSTLDFGTGECSIYGMRGEQGKSLVSGTSATLTVTGASMSGGYYFYFGVPGTAPYGFHHKEGLVTFNNDITSDGLIVNSNKYDNTISVKHGFYDLQCSGNGNVYTGKYYKGGARLNNVGVWNNMLISDGSFWKVDGTEGLRVSGNLIISGTVPGNSDGHMYRRRLLSNKLGTFLDVRGSVYLYSGTIDFGGINTITYGQTSSPIGSGPITVLGNKHKGWLSTGAGLGSGTALYVNQDGLMLASSTTNVHARNWDQTNGRGTIRVWGSPTISSDDNMVVKGVWNEGCTATVNCPQNMGNGALQQVSGTASPTFNAGGWIAAMEPAGNSTVITTGTRKLYVENRGHPYEGVDGAFWNLIISGNATKGISGGQNTTFRVKNDFTIQAGSTFSMEDLSSNVTTALDEFALNVSGTFTVDGTYSGNYVPTCPDQQFQRILIGSAGKCSATSGTTQITSLSSSTFNPNAHNAYNRSNDGSFIHNNGTVLVYQGGAGLQGRANAHTNIYNVNSVGDGVGNWYNTYVSGNTVGQATYFNGDSSTVSVWDNNLTINNASFYPTDDCLIKGSVLLEDTGGNGVTFGDPQHDYIVSGDFVVNKGAGAAKIKNADIILYGTFHNNGGVWDT